MKRQDAPGELEWVRAFINTRDLELASDSMDSAQGLRSWLAERSLIPPGTPVGEEDLRHAVEVRESLRALARTNSGQQMDPEAARTLDGLASGAVVRLRFREDGTRHVGPEEDGGVRAGLGRLLAVVGTADRDGTWQRLKVCPAEDCLWAFYDHSKNRSGTWCQMAECGNRAKARTYRTRHLDSAESSNGVAPRSARTTPGPLPHVPPRETP
ncbi:CGNR zinc finger domain-containing protein [Streptomyces sp. 110]|uniref:CGNR zinc finger domain-containing protein n=1 Tax=Streptomyces endocoffeicus TaxID=2898945 RepID=A0ABS1Q174_9ACTN|nr:CGNR zinc finger domain-containing protein [Streptomyces endocoffeicus]MBL1118422.1 CGNR zinc finger domain-containing protein [Streptomyces endocoffeicus]